MASTSSREIGLAAAVPAVAPDDAADPDGADAPAGAGDPDGARDDGTTFAACFEPKMADTMLPNTLMMPSCPYGLWLHSARGRARCAAATNSQVLSIADTF
jgi:hypothetical protein